VLGISDNSRGCLFDLDGVLTQTARVHAAAWPETLDDFLRHRARRTGEWFVPFDPVAGAGIVVRDLAGLLDER
jgi:beta-phosphoglucomutase-like phosphatase (HAD superfamily)